MQLSPEKLAEHMAGKGLVPIYMISGDEPLQLNETGDYIRSKAREQGAEERIVLDAGVGFDWNSLVEASANMSLFSRMRLIELRLGSSKPGREGGKVLTEYCQRPSPDNVLLITSNALKNQTKNKWYQAIDKAGVTIQVWPIAPDNVPAWIHERVRKHNKHIDKNAAQLLANHVEGNMLAASQEVEKLCLLTDGDKIRIDTVMSSATNMACFNVFSLIECAYANDNKRLLMIANEFSNEGMEPMAFYGALMWDYRRLCSMSYRLNHGAKPDKLFSEYRIWDAKRKRAMTAILRRYSLTELHELLKQAIALEKIIKSNDKNTAWNKLSLLLLAFAGHRIIDKKYSIIPG